MLKRLLQGDRRGNAATDDHRARATPQWSAELTAQSGHEGQEMHLAKTAPAAAGVAGVAARARTTGDSGASAKQGPSSSS
jgi:hypothetical protein